jgi:hypothetical protein
MCKTLLEYEELEEKCVRGRKRNREESRARIKKKAN